MFWLQLFLSNVLLLAWSAVLDYAEHPSWVAIVFILALPVTGLLAIWL